VIDFAIPDELADLRDRTATFVRDVILPYESDPRRDHHGPTEELRLELVAAARQAGLVSPHVGTEWGGLGLSHVGKALVFEESGYSMLGPVAMHIAAPDEGNMHLLEAVASDEQKERFLRPLASGEQRSMFMMTEPDGGAGSDPSMMKTRADEQPDGSFRINGCKWLITGALGARIAIVMARTFDRDGTDVGATMFLTEADAPGIDIVEVLGTMDHNSVGGHSVIELNDLHVPAESVLGEVGGGFRYAQVRLGPARLTHCMRWLGAARRCHDIATEYARTRHAFGRPIGEHEGIGFQLADNLTDMQTARLLIWHCAWVLDQGDQAREESSMAKLYCSEATSRVVDRSVQVLGGTGITSRTVVRQIYEDIRAFRIYDGPSEVHRMAIARRALRTPR
jgi:acyl-CoA dehydrogenase